MSSTWEASLRLDGYEALETKISALIRWDLIRFPCNKQEIHACIIDQDLILNPTTCTIQGGVGSEPLIGNKPILCV